MIESRSVQWSLDQRTIHQPLSEAGYKRVTTRTELRRGGKICVEKKKKKNTNRVRFWGASPMCIRFIWGQVARRSSPRMGRCSGSPETTTGCNTRINVKISNFMATLVISASLTPPMLALAQPTATHPVDRRVRNSAKAPTEPCTKWETQKKNAAIRPLTFNNQQREKGRRRA